MPVRNVGAVAVCAQTTTGTQKHTNPATHRLISLLSAASVDERNKTPHPKAHSRYPAHASIKPSTHAPSNISPNSLSSYPCTLPSLAATPIYTYKVIAKYPHSTHNYTEGFFYKDGLFYEGTGLEGHSQILITEPATGKVIQHTTSHPSTSAKASSTTAPTSSSGPGRPTSASSIDRATLRTISQFHYDGEGWGMTRTPTEIITSDGTSTLRFRNPTTFAETRNILVHDGPTLIEQLNELEYIPAHGSQKEAEIYANIWHSERIARISPHDGHVIAWIDLHRHPPRDPRKSTPNPSSTA